ncbi:MAG: hypothetical protein DHS20C14_04070 [Phycisphaeraceae bacterium]|nr:MAG: hypothetical protein DHS20C14_04070 [Phycisphaeraceae bacterium]
MKYVSLSFVALAAGSCLAASADAPVGVSGVSRAPLTVISDTEIYVGDERFHSWAEVADSGHFHTESTRCAKPAQFALSDAVLRAPSDCSFSNTSILPDYDPSVDLYRIPVVVHVIQRTNGTGFLSESRVQSQIDILNEDFLAISGTLGAGGTDSQIEFYLATEDPSGSPTNGITYSSNNTWFNDGGSYWNSLAWDPDRYLNIYTNDASGNLGYVPFLPQTSPSSVGGSSDRVVVLYSSFGRNAPLTPFHLGRTTTHEVGHYLGLDHTFASGGCPSAGGCSNNGDLICDTNPESSPTFGCPSSRSSCGFAAPKDNYMDYSDDICMTKFTPDQSNRMRCTLLNYRDEVYSVVSSGCIGDCDGNGSFNVDDVDCFVAAFTGGDLASADCDGSGGLNIDDVDCFIDAFTNQCQ